MAVYTDDFNRANGAINVGNSNWAAIDAIGLPNIVTNKVNSNGGAAYYNVAFSNDQYCQFSIANTNIPFGGTTSYVAIRCAGSDQSCYRVSISISDNGIDAYDRSIWIERLNAAGAATVIGSSFADTSTDPFYRITAVGNVITAQTGPAANGPWTDRASATDSTYASGKAGFFTAGTNPQYDNFEAGDIGGGGGGSGPRNTAIYLQSGTVGGRSSTMTLRFTPDGQKRFS